VSDSGTPGLRRRAQVAQWRTVGLEDADVLAAAAAAAAAAAHSGGSATSADGAAPPGAAPQLPGAGAPQHWVPAASGAAWQRPPAGSGGGAAAPGAAVAAAVRLPEPALCVSPGMSPVRPNPRRRPITPETGAVLMGALEPGAWLRLGGSSVLTVCMPPPPLRRHNSRRPLPHAPLASAAAARRHGAQLHAETAPSSPHSGAPGSPGPADGVLSDSAAARGPRPRTGGGNAGGTSAGALAPAPLGVQQPPRVRNAGRLQADPLSMSLDGGFKKAARDAAAAAEKTPGIAAMVRHGRGRRGEARMGCA
jgi:hypothetical protein